MPSGPRKRRAAKRKKKEELEKILDSRVATISEDAIDNSNSSKDANLGDHPGVATSTVVDSSEPENKSVNDDGEAISDELNVLPLVAEGENCAKESEVVLTSNQDPANVISKNSSEDAVHDVDAPVDILHVSVEKGNGDTYVEMNDDAPFDSQTTAISRSDKGRPVQEKGDATLTDHMASEATEDSLWHDDGAFQASHNRLVGILSHKEIAVEDKNVGNDRKTLAVSEQDDILKNAIEEVLNTTSEILWQDDGAFQASHNRLVGILSHKEIAVEDKNVGNDRKTLAVSEQDDNLKNAIEEVLDTTNKLRELLIKLLHGLDTIQPMEVA